MFQIHIQCILCFIQCNLSFCKIKKSNYNNKFSLNAVVKRYFLLSSYFKSLYRLCLLSYTIQYMVLEIETSLIIISYLGVINLVIASKMILMGQIYITRNEYLQLFYIIIIFPIIRLDINEKQLPAGINLFLQIHLYQPALVI